MASITNTSEPKLVATDTVKVGFLGGYNNITERDGQPAGYTKQNECNTEGKETDNTGMGERWDDPTVVVA